MPIAATISFRPLAIFAHLDDVANNQVPFALSQTINAAALAFQSGQRAGMTERFVIRRPWVLGEVKVAKFSDKRENPMTAIISLSPQVAKFLEKFETGGSKTPERSRSIAAPASAAFPREEVIPMGKRPSAMDLVTKGNTTKGADRTFLLTGGNRRAIYQRVGPGEIRLLFSLLPDVPISPLLQFQQTAVAIIPAFLRDNFPRFFANAVRTARPAK